MIAGCKSDLNDSVKDSCDGSGLSTIESSKGSHPFHFLELVAWYCSIFIRHLRDPCASVIRLQQYAVNPRALEAISARHSYRFSTRATYMSWREGLTLCLGFSLPAGFSGLPPLLATRFPFQSLFPPVTNSSCWYPSTTIFGRLALYAADCPPLHHW